MKELLKRLLTRKLLSVEILFASLFLNILALSSPIFVIQVLNRYVSHGVDGTLYTLTMGVMIAITMEFGFRQARLRLASEISIEPNKELSQQALAVLTQAKLMDFERLSTGLKQEVLRGLDAIQLAYNGTNISTIIDLPFVILYIIALFMLSPILAWVTLTAVILGLLVGMAAQYSARQPSQDLVKASSVHNSHISSAIDNGDVIRVFGGANFLTSFWGTQTQMIRSLQQRIAYDRSFWQSLSQSIAMLMSVAIIAVGATLVVAGDLTVGALIGANILAGRAFAPVSRLIQIGEQLTKAQQAIFYLQEFKKLPLERQSGTALKRFSGNLEFKDLGFAFPSSSMPLFESMSITISSGQILVVSGCNGSGKTTVAQMLVGLIEPLRGQILLDGIDLRQMAPQWWRQQVIYLPQEAHFLNITIKENILINNRELKDDQINRVVTMAGLRSFLDQSMQGLDTPLALNGRNLSLGIRRRLAFARALANGGKIMVLDEPTEGMDEDGCQCIYQTIDELRKKDRSIVICSNDKELVKRATHRIDLTQKPIPKIYSPPMIKG